MNKETKICQNCKKSFAVEPEDFDFYTKMDVLPPVFCPDCRMVKKLLWRNEKTLYKRTCDLCGKSIITIFHPRYTSPVYCVDCHMSDTWDPYAYGIDYNPERPFFEQFSTLLSRVPKAATHVGAGSSAQNINSEYINFAGGNKNCYLIFNSAQNEDCNYCRGIMKTKETTDVYFADQVERCYEGVNVNRCNSVLWSQNTVNCLNSYFLLNCSDLQNCFGCVNLRHKYYCFFNEQLEKEEWEKKVNDILGSYKKTEETKKKFEKFILRFPRKENNNLKVVNCFGDYLFESKDCYSCFESFMSEECKWSVYIKLLKDSYDVVGRGMQSELLLETVAVGHGCSRVIGSWSVETSHDIEYSFDMRACSSCIGCVGIKHGEYSILNKKYSEREYKELREKIITELRQSGMWGSYLPEKLSPWAYNETLAQDNFPLKREDAIQKGFRWEDEIPRTKDKETLSWEKVPDDIKSVDGSLLNEILKCTSCGFNYKLVAPELAFYKQMNIPIPRKCFNCRYVKRIEKRGGFILYDRVCDKCQKSIKTTFSPERPEIVYCESCYQLEVI